MYDASSTQCVFVAASGASIRFSSHPTLQLHTVAALGFFLVYIVYSTSAPLLTHPTVIITLHSLHDTTACSVAYFFSNARRHAQQVHVSLACICRCLGLNLHRHFFLRRAIRYNSQNLFPVAQSPFFVQAHANVIAGLPYNPYASMPECLLPDVWLVPSDVCCVSCV